MPINVIVLAHNGCLPKPITVEFMLIINTQKKHRGLSVYALCEKIRLAEIAALHHHAEMVSSLKTDAVNA
jgi:hypothetical protein